MIAAFMVIARWKMVGCLHEDARACELQDSRTKRVVTFTSSNSEVRGRMFLSIPAIDIEVERRSKR